MKKVFLSLMVGMCFSLYAEAQVKVAEPEFAEETMLLTSDTESIVLKRENGSIKTKAGAGVYLVGVGKIKSRLTLSGIKSVNEVKVPANARLVIKGKDNATDPNSYISVFKFELTKNERRFQLAEAGTFTGTERNNTAAVDFQAKKYGESSYLIQLSDLEPGEYGILIGDPNSLTNKNSMKVTTFTVE